MVWRNLYISPQWKVQLQSHGAHDLCRGLKKGCSYPKRNLCFIHMLGNLGTETATPNNYLRGEGWWEVRGSLQTTQDSPGARGQINYTQSSSCQHHARRQLSILLLLLSHQDMRTWQNHLLPLFVYFCLLVCFFCKLLPFCPVAVSLTWIFHWYYSSVTLHF